MSNDVSREQSYQQAFRKLLEVYVDRLVNTGPAIENIIKQQEWAALGKSDLERAQSLAHGLAGSGGTFGFHAVTDAGRQTEHYIIGLIKALPEGGRISAEDFQNLKEQLLALGKVCQDAAREHSAAEGRTVQAGPEPRPAGSLPHVLVVDDDEHITSLLGIILGRHNIRVSTARDGIMAQRILSRDMADLIILDIMMPGFDGQEMLRRIRQDPAYVNVPVVMLTSKAQERDVKGALHSGADAYIVKPFEPEAIVARITKILEASAKA